MVIEKYLRRHYVNQFLKRNASLLNVNSALEIGSGEKWRQLDNSITLNCDEDARADLTANAEDLNGIIDNSTFDLILCLEVLEHTQHPEKIISEINRVLKKGGVALISVPFMLEIHSKYDFQIFTKTQLSFLLKDFQKIDIEENGGLYSVLFHLLRMTKIGNQIYPILNNIGYFLDKIIRKNSNICIGYTIIVQK